MITAQQYDEMKRRVEGNKPSQQPIPPSGPLIIIVTGQIMGGKNNMIVTRTGKHFPKASWAKWRDEKVAEVKRQLPAGFKTINEPVNVRLTYVAGDKRRRDQPAIIDSLFHVLEKAGVVEDDTLIWVNQSTRFYCKERPCATMLFETTI